MPVEVFPAAFGDDVGTTENLLREIVTAPAERIPGLMRC